MNLRGVGAGRVSIQAIYGGDSTYPGSASNTVILTITKVTPKILVKCSPNPVAIGVATACQATVIGFSPTGLVTWTQTGGTGGIIPPSQSCVLVPVSVNVSRCTLNFNVSGPGKVDVSVQYSGDLNNNPALVPYILTVT